jgi:hypothetical protein
MHLHARTKRGDTHEKKTRKTHNNNNRTQERRLTLLDNAARWVNSVVVAGVDGDAGVAVASVWRAGVCTRGAVSGVFVRTARLCAGADVLLRCGSL